VDQDCVLCERKIDSQESLFFSFHLHHTLCENCSKKRPHLNTCQCLHTSSLLLPIFNLFLFQLVIGLFLSSISLENYITTVICPFTRMIESILAFFVQDVYYVVEKWTNSLCFNESGFWKYYTDFWVQKNKRFFSHILGLWNC